MMPLFDLDHWREILATLRGNKLRTFLTAFGVFWGIFMLVIMLGSGNGLENGITRGWGETPTNTFFLWTQRTTKPWRGMTPGRTFEMNNADVDAIRAQIPEAEIVSPRNQLGGYQTGNQVVHDDKAGAFNVMGDYPAVRRQESLRILRGRFLNPLDLEEQRKVAVIGDRVRQMLFEPEEDPVGDHIEINGVDFKVVGLFGTLAAGDDGDRDAQTIYVPFTTFQRVFNYGDRVGWLAVTSRADVPASIALEKTLTLLKQRHSVAPDDERAFGHFNMEEEFQKVQGLFAGIGLLVWIVGTGTLAAGAIGVSNIMLVIVRERTHEIGVRRALGATPLTVMLQIVLEAVLLTLVAGWLGLVAGMGLVDLVDGVVGESANQAFLHPDVTSGAALQALGILVLAGVLAGLLPALRAVRVTPVEALRTL